MELRCRPNDLCRILQGPNRDRFITVTRNHPSPTHEGWTHWFYEDPLLPSEVADHEQLTFYDHVLEPIRPPDGTLDSDHSQDLRMPTLVEA